MTTIVTPKQNAYLKKIDHEGGMSTREAAEAMDVTMATADKMLRKLKVKGLINSEQGLCKMGRQHTHTIVIPYEQMVADGLLIQCVTYGHKIPEEEIQHAATLRNEGLVGQRLIDQHHRLYPARPKSSVQNIIATAVQRGLCR